MEHNENVVICPPCGESTLKGGKGVVNKDTLMDTPPSALRATSKAEKLFDTPPTPLRGTSPARGAEKAALCAKHPAGGEVNGGFTLIELLVVVLIIGILAAVAVPQYKIAVAKSRVASILPIISTLEKAAYAYYWANGEVTTSIHALDVDIPCTETFAGEDAGSNAGKPYWTCGKDFLVQLGTSGVYASYCPGHNGSSEDCNANRDYQIGYKYVSPIGEGDHYCVIKNESSLGRSVCKALSIGEMSNITYYIN